MNINHNDIENVNIPRDRKDFEKILANNPGIIIFKFGADWCRPCQLIKNFVHEYVDKLPPHIAFYDIDIDESFDIYGYLRSKKMVNGVPVLLAYYKNNNSYVSDHCVVGTNKEEIKQFFTTCVNHNPV